MSLPTHLIDIARQSGGLTMCRMKARVDLFQQTGLFKTAIFEDDCGYQIIAGKQIGQWSEIAMIGTRPALDVAREALSKADIEKNQP